MSEFTALLTTSGLTRRFGGLTAVDDLNFEVRLGRIHAVIGPNGAGKTTLFNLITGGLQPTAGEIYFQGLPIKGMAPYRITRLGIARKFQITQIFNDLTVGDNVRLALRTWGSKSGSGWIDAVNPADALDQLLKVTRLADKEAVRAGALSHGEKQRLELAMVLGTGARLVLLDEPTSGLSLEERDAMVEVLHTLAAETTIVVTEHDFKFIKQLADIVTVLHEGRKLFEGTVAQVEQNEDVRRIYLGAS